MSDAVKDGVKRVSDIVPGQVEVDKFVDIEEMLDRDILIHDFQEREGENGMYVTVICSELDSEEKIGFNCGGKVVMKKLNYIRDNASFPVLAKIFKPEGKRYFDIQ